MRTHKRISEILGPALYEELKEHCQFEDGTAYRQVRPTQRVRCGPGARARLSARRVSDV